MKGFIKYNEDETSQAFGLIERINVCMGFPTQDGLTLTWQDGVPTYCYLDSQSASTIFWGSVVYVDTNQIGGCLTQSEIDSIIDLPNDVYLCGTNM